MRIVASLLIAAALCGGAVSEALSFGAGNFFAVIDQDGEVIRSSGVQGARSLSTGKYVVNFSRPVSACAITATPIGSDGGQISVAVSKSIPQRVVVAIFNGRGAPADRSFSLIVLCAA